MTYEGMEHSAVEKVYTLKTVLFLPLLKILTRLGVTADRVTYARAFVALVMLYQLFIAESLMGGIIVYVIIYIMDGLDGSLARFTNTQSDKGKFNDVFIDQLVYALFVLGLAFLGLGNAYILFLHVIISGALYILASICKNQNKPSDWLFHPEANLMYLKFIACAPVLLYLFFKINFIDFIYGLLNVWMTVLSVYYFIVLQKIPYKKSL